jgi:hypothetical protein
LVWVNNRKNQLGFPIDFFFICEVPNQTNKHMLPNKERLGIEIAIRPHLKAIEVIKIQMQLTEGAIDRKFRILDEYSNTWTYSMWKNWKDSLQAEISYKEYLKIVLEAYQK